MSTMGSHTKKKLSLNTVSVDLGCSCSRPKLSLLFHPKPKLKTTKKPHKRQQPQQHHHYSSSSSWTINDDDETSTTTTTTTATSSSSAYSTAPLSPTDHYSSKKTTTKSKNDKRKSKEQQKEAARGFGRVGGEGVAVEKESDDPYLDFRHSMLQMILENEIYSKDDLRELLNCFLQLNDPSNHGIIVRAFTEIWEGVFSVRSSLQHSQTNTPKNIDNNTQASHYYGGGNGGGNNDNYYYYNDQNVSRDNCYYYY